MSVDYFVNLQPKPSEIEAANATPSNVRDLCSFCFILTAPVSWNDIDGHIAGGLNLIDKTLFGPHLLNSATEFYLDLNQLEQVSADEQCGDLAAQMLGTLYGKGFIPLPILSLNAEKNYLNFIRISQVGNRVGVGIRITVAQLNELDSIYRLNKILEHLGYIYTEATLIVEFGCMNSASPDFLKTLAKVPRVSDWKNVVMCGGSFPKDMGYFRKIGKNSHPRYESIYFGDLLKSNTAVPRNVILGDYATRYPIYRPQLGKFVPTVGYRQTTFEGYDVYKGTREREDTRSEQMRLFAQQIRNSEYHPGDNFSWGNRLIGRWSSGLEDGYNQKLLRAAEINNHIITATNEMSDLRSNIRRAA